MRLSKLLFNLADRLLNLPKRTRFMARQRSKSSQIRSIESLEDRTLLSITAILTGGGSDVEFRGDVGTSNSIVLSVDAGGRLEHNLGGLFGFNSNNDLDSSTPGDQVRFLYEITNLSYLDQDPTPDDSVSFGPVSFNLINASFNLLSVKAGSIDVLPASRILTTGDGAVDLSASQSIRLSGGANITSMNGGITLSANQQATSTTGSFVGVQVIDSSISNNSGTIKIDGRGGDGASGQIGVQIEETMVRGGSVQIAGEGGSGSFNNYGVLVDFAATVTANGPGTVFVKGIGGGNGANNHGVYVRNNASITSGGGDVHVVGDGSLTGVDGNYGVNIDLAGRIASGPGGDVFVDGTGHGTGQRGVGIRVGVDGAIQTSGGNGALITGIGSTNGTDFNYGIELDGSATQIRSGGSLVVNGMGQGTGGFNAGVWVASGATITSDGGNVQVNGTGGGGSGDNNFGVGIDLSGGEITAGDSGDVFVTGIGGSGTGNSNSGVVVNGVNSGIDQTGGGHVTVVGIGKGTGAANSAYGVFVSSGGRVASSFYADLDIHGEGGAGTGADNFGVLLEGATISAVSASMRITGVEGGGSNGFGIMTRNNNNLIEMLMGDGTGKIYLISDSIELGPQTSVFAGSEEVRVQTLTAGAEIDLGATSNSVGGPLSLSDAELDRVSARVIELGNFDGTITVSAPITHSVADFAMYTSADIVFGNQFDIGDAVLNLNLSNPAGSVQPVQFSTDIVANFVYINGNLGINIDGLTADSQYSQLNLSCPIDLSMTGLMLTGNYNFAMAGTITIVSAPAISGTFVGLPNNSTIPFRGQLATIIYTQTSIMLSLPFVNLPPVIDSPGSASVFENISNSSVVLTVSASDPNIPAQPLVISLTGDDASQFQFDSLTGEIRFVVSPDFEAPADFNGDNVYQFTVSVSDGNGEVTNQDITVSVVDVNESPVFTFPAMVSVAENQASVLTVTATDIDRPAQLLTFSISGGADRALFAIDSTTGVLTFLSAPDYETPLDVGGDNVYDVDVTVQDNGGTANGGQDQAVQSLAVVVTDSNDAPTDITLSVASLFENNATNAAVGTFAGTDPDLGDTLTFSLVAGAIGVDNTDFSIVGNTLLISPSADFETKSLYVILVQAADQGGLAFQKFFTISIKDVNEPPVFASGTSISLDENQATAFTVTAIDQDLPAQSLTYSISGGSDQSLLFIDATTGVLSFIAAPDFENPTDAGGDNTYDVAVSVGDGNGGNATQEIAITILNVNDGPSTLTISSQSIMEGDSGTTLAVFTVTSSDPIQGGFTVDFSLSDGTANQSEDYSLVTISPLTFSGIAGETQTITVTINGDTKSETDETFTVTLGTVIAATSEIANSISTGAVGTGTILNDDPLPELSIGDVTLAEGDAGTTNAVFTITLSAVSGQTVTVTAFTADGTASSLSDYVALPPTLVTFLPGVITQTITIPVNGDSPVEADETFLVNLNSATNGTIVDDQGVGAITNDDSNILTISAPVITESNTDQTVTFTVTSPNAVEGGFDVAITTTDGTAGSTDYSLATTSVHFNGTVGETQLVSVTIRGDSIVEDNETFNVALGTISNTTSAQVAAITAGASAAATIVDDDSNILTISAPVITESNTDQTVTFTVTSPNAVEGGFDVAITTTDGTAESADYSLVSTSIHFNGTVGETQLVSVTIRGDSIVEDNETFSVVLGTISNTTSAQVAAITTGASAAATIVDDDLNILTISAPVITESNTDQTVTFTVTSPNAVEGGFDVPISTVDGTADNSDYSLDTSTLHFFGTAGETHSVIVTIKGDVAVELDETFDVVLGTVTGTSSVQSAAVISGSAATGTIINDDTIVTVSVARVKDGTEASSPSAGQFIVSQSAPSFTDTVVTYSVSGTATVGGDYTPLTGTVTILAGQTTAVIDVSVINDAIVEGPESVSITLTGFGAHAAPVILDPAPANLTAMANILDDDTATFTLSNASGSEGSGALIFTVLTDNPLDIDITITVNFADVTTSGGTDYDSASQQVTLLAGQTSQTVSVGIIDDTLLESTESFTLSLSPSTPLAGRVVNFSALGTGTITDDDNPHITSVPTANVAENTPTSSVVLDVDADLVAGQTFTYSLSGVDSSLFQINSGTGEITFVNSPDFELPFTSGNSNTYQVTVTVSNGLGAATSQALTINVVGVNDNSPIFSSAANISIPENSIAIQNVVATDADLPFQAVTYSITGGADQARFRIDTNTGALSFQVAPDFEIPADAGANNVYNLTVTANDGAGQTTTQEISVTVLNVDEPLVVVLPNPPAVYLPQSGAMVIDPGAGAGDPDTTGYSYNRGTLTVAITGVEDPGDRLGVLSQGTGTGKFGVLFGLVVYESSLVVIGKIVSGPDGGPLKIEFTSFATPEIVDKLLKNITFGNIGGSPMAGIRNISFQFTDITGTEQRDISSTTINVEGTLNSATIYTNATAPVPLLAGIVSPSNAADLKGGRLMVTVTNGANRKDQLNVLNREGITIAGKDVLYQGQKIGRLTRKQNSLRVDLTTSAASSSAVQSLMHAIAFSTRTSNTSRVDRVLQFTLSDGHGKNSTVHKTVHVV